MRIQAIEITDFKAFLGTHTINVGGKNLFIYGENGSRKNALYYVLKVTSTRAFSPKNTCYFSLKMRQIRKSAITVSFPLKTFHDMLPP